VIPYFASPRIGLSVHTLGATEGVLLLALGLLWPKLALRAVASRLAFWCLLYSALAILAAYTTAAAWGVGNETIVLAGSFLTDSIMEPPFRRHSSRSYRIPLRQQVSLLSRLFFGVFVRQLLLQPMTEALPTALRSNQSMKSAHPEMRPVCLPRHLGFHPGARLP
jgi:hypothetical protein